MKILLPLFSLALGAATALLFGPSDRPSAAIAASTPPAAPVLVELFTSQGCSSCPPADRLLERLDAEGAVVAVSRPVTYWDRLGWKDTLARAANDALQDRYARRGLPGAGVYTPEAVVQGGAAAVGSDERALRRMIGAAPSDAALRLDGGRVVASRSAAGAELRFLAIAHRASVDVARGENGNRRLGYTNVVLAEAAVPCPANGACAAAMPSAIAGQRGADRWAVLLQDRAGGRVHAVRWIGRPAK